MEQRDLENGINGRGALDDESGRVAALLGALPRVEAPANFEFGVRSKIAAGRPQVGSLFPFLKLVAPLCLVLVVGALVMSYSVWPGKTDLPQVDAPAIASETRTSEVAQPADPQTPPSTVSDSTRQDQAAVRPQTQAQSRSAGPIPTAAANSRSNRSEGNSTEFLIRRAPVIGPKGFESVTAQVSNSNSNLGPGISLGEVLRQWGLDGTFSGSGWKVSSAVTNSIGERSGVKIGDVIESIDGKAVNQLKTITGAFAPKVVNVIREGKTISLTLRN